MADIIRLEPHSKRPAAAMHGGEPAAIIIFPGVRYEKPAAAEANPPSGKGKPRKAN